MEEILEQMGEAGHDEVHLWVALVNRLRPPPNRVSEKGSSEFAALARLLEDRKDLRIRLRQSLISEFHKRKVVSLYVSSGLLPSTGFFSETARRISGRLLPEVIDSSYMKGVLSVVFHRVDDEVWVNTISDEDWIAFINLIFANNDSDAPGVASDEVPGPVLELIEALRILSYQVCSIGLDPELVRIDPTLEEHESPFMAQNAELVSYLGHYKAWWHNRKTSVVDEKHLTVMLDQCRDVVLRIRRRAAKLGTSLSLTFKLERLQQHLDRVTVILRLLIRLREGRTVPSIAADITHLAKTVIHAECRKNKLSDYWGKNLELLSLRMTESASRTGERYIASNRSEHLGILRSAALGGLIIALMAALKLVLGWQGFAPLNAALAFCLNYGIGFALIHVLGGTVATKQPAMTANAIAASIGEAKGKHRNLDNLVELIVRTIRSQIAAIVGNVGVAIPTAMLLSLIVFWGSGSHFLTPAESMRMLEGVDPLGGTVLFAAIAGLCLFLSGLIAGYYDNLSSYGRIPQRLLQLRWPRRVFGEARMQRVSVYVERNLGALAGNFFFGFLLGGVTALGVLFGLPLDIRHIAFSSAYVGYAIVGLDFAIPLQLALLSAAGIVLIGLTNLSVSFALTLTVAMRARRITFAQGQDLVHLLLKRFLRRPHDFLFSPRFDNTALANTTSQADKHHNRSNGGGEPQPSSKKSTTEPTAAHNALGGERSKG